MVVDPLVGRKLTGIRRILYVHNANIDGWEGPIELEFDGGRVLLFESGGNGEDLVIGTEAWVDGFSGDLSEENVEFLAGSGKWEAIPMGSSAWSYGRFIGRELTQVVELAPNSLRLSFGDLFIDATSGGDELSVKFGSS